MEKYTIKQLKGLVNSGAAIEVSSFDRGVIPEHYTQVGYSSGMYGCNGKLLKGDDTNKLYVVLNSSIFAF